MERILLIHGFGCDNRFWNPQVSALNSYNISLLDLPYHGGATTGVDKSLAGLAEWVVETQLQTPAILAGHSLGGMIALYICHYYPDLVKGIILADSFPSLKLNNQYLPGMYPQSMDSDILEWIEITRKEIISRMSQDIYDEIWPSVRDFDARPWLREISCPVLGIYGGRGRYTRQEGNRLKQDLMLDCIPADVTLKIIPSAGHFVNLEYPDIFNNTVTEWLIINTKK